MYRLSGFRSIASATAGVVAVALATAALPTTSASASTLAPSNDSFATPQVLSGRTGALNPGPTNTGATAEAGEPDHKPGLPPHASVWYRWTSPVNGHVVFRTRGSSFDTVLAVYTGSKLTALTPIANNDDETFSDTFTRQSQVNFTAAKGTTYRIAVDSFNPTETGSISLSWMSNDDFANATTLTPGSLDSVSSVSVDSSGATAQSGEPAHDGAAPGRSVWFSWTAPATGMGHLETFDSDYLADLALYTGTSVKGLTLIERNDNFGEPNTGAEIFFPAKQGTTYRIAVSGSNESSGSLRLQYGVERPTIAVGDVAADEGDGGSTGFDFFVGLSAASAQTITVTFSTSDDSAHAGSDYKAKNVTVTFLPGQTSKLIAVPVLGDRVVEPVEKFIVTLSNPTNAVLSATDSNVAFILNDD